MINRKDIIDICKYSNISYLNEILNNIKSKEDKDKIENMFNSHMEEIADYCIENFNNQLSENFIKGLHKIHYPKGYTESKKTLKGDGEYIYMIPGQYKSFKNFDYVDPKDIKNEIKYFIDDYNKNILLIENKYDFILSKLIQFLKIHPFGNGNGRIISIIIDLMFINNKMKPLYFKNIQEKNKELFIEMIKKSIIHNNVNYINDIIKNYK